MNSLHRRNTYATPVSAHYGDTSTVKPRKRDAFERLLRFLRRKRWQQRDLREATDVYCAESEGPNSTKHSFWSLPNGRRTSMDASRNVISTSNAAGTPWDSEKSSLLSIRLPRKQIADPNSTPWQDAVVSRQQPIS